jgi:hypothetical protein
LELQVKNTELGRNIFVPQHPGKNKVACMILEEKHPANSSPKIMIVYYSAGKGGLN